MPELSPPLSQSGRALRRLEAIERTSAQIARLQSDLRLELVALALQDTPFGIRTYLCDELTLALAESPGTADRMITQAHRYSEFPQVIARVGLPLSDGGWSVRHADALLDAIAGLGLDSDVQQQVIDLVADHPDARTPHQIRHAAQAAVMVLDPDAAERRLARAKQQRRVGAALRWTTPLGRTYDRHPDPSSEVSKARGLPGRGARATVVPPTQLCELYGARTTAGERH
jgi:hypothetical protein